MSAPSRAAALRPGELFADRYRVQRLLGEGGMGTVYEVIDERLDDRVALKIMRFTAGDEEDIRRFQREVRLARRITHPNVARTHDIGEHGGLHFLTMELINGDSLEDLIEERQAERVDRQGPFSPAEAIELAIPMADGLAAAHAANVVHRDLKPPNILVVPAAGGRALRPAITDFGVARASEGGAKTTRTVGTPLYMAPEQLLGEPIGPATDLYAFGVVLYEMLTGRLPFEAPTPMAVALARCRMPPIDPRRDVDVPQALADLLLACLQMTPADRPASAEAIAAQLRVFARTTSAETVALAASVTTGSWTPSGGSVPPGSLSISSPFAPMSPGKRALAVLPFEYRGPADLDFLGESLAQEIVDTLSRTRGLRVIGFGAARAHKTGDPRDIGRTLGADSIVAGTVQAGANAERVRISVRLIEVDTGVQIWSARFDKRFEDVMEMQEIVSQRIADALRLEVNLGEHRGRANPEAIELYLRAKGALDMRYYLGAFEAMGLLERSIELEPSFAPAIAYYAISCIHAWWIDLLGTRRQDWATLVKSAVERALRVAPDLAESHLAAAMQALHLGDLRTTATELANTLEIAPTLPLAHRYLAEIQCEAGRPAEGLKRARLALELDPSLHATRYCMVRHHALAGEREACKREMEFLAKHLGLHQVTILNMHVRFKLWFGEADELKPLLAEIRRSPDPFHVIVSQFVSYAFGESDAAVLDRVTSLAGSFGNARLLALMSQLVAEVHAFRGDDEAALVAIERASDTALVDIVWLELCPLFERIRSDPRYLQAMAKVRDRASAVWQLRSIAGPE